MKPQVKPIPEGYSTVTPHLVIKGAAQAIEFYKQAFGAKEVVKMSGPDGKAIMHAEIKIGNSMLFLADEFLPHAKSPKTVGGTPITVHLYVEDVDKVFEAAVKGGATPVMPPQDMFWGDRYGKLVDPFGHEWSIATHKEDPTPEQMEERMKEAFKHGCGGGEPK